MKIQLFKLLLISKLFGKAAAALYQTYVYNCNTQNYSKTGNNVMLARPLFVQPSQIELGSYTRLQQNVRTIISQKQKVIIKKYTAIGAGAIIIPGNHTPTVSTPQYLSYIGVNDINNTLIIEEDVWIGAMSTLLYKGSIGRGAIIGAGALVTKRVPPYAVVSGIPAKITAVRFSLEQILEHEKHLYPANERLSREYLEELFNNEYAGKRTIGTDSMTKEEYKHIVKEKERLKIPDYDLE